MKLLKFSENLLEYINLSKQNADLSAVLLKFKI